MLHDQSVCSTDPSRDSLVLSLYRMYNGPRTSRHGRPHYWKACLIIFACEVAERIAFYAISSNLTVYLTTVMQESVADAARNYNNWSGTTFLTPFIGAFVADAFLGRYWTIFWSMIVYFMALVFVTISMSFKHFKPHCDEFNLKCEKPTWFQTGFLFGSLYMMAFGAGGIKACVTAFSADQFDENDPVQRRQRISVMNWWWLSLSTGIMLSAAIFPWVQQVADWVWVGAIPTLIVGFVTLAFVFAHPIYYHQIPSGSAFTRVFQVLAVAFRNRNLQLPEDHRDLHEHDDARPNSPSLPNYRLLYTTRLRYVITHLTRYYIKALSSWVTRRSWTQTRFLDKAALPTDAGGASSALDGNVCTVTQVEEVKLLLGVLPIWTTNLPNSVGFAQVGTFFVNQGTTMDRSIGSGFTVPAASLISFVSLTVVIFLPLYEKILVPLTRKCTGNFRGITLLQRIGVGLFISTVAVVIAGVVENYRLKVATSHAGSVPIPMSIFWLVPQYFLVGLYEVFIVVGQGEFFYLQAAPNLRSLGTALFFGNVAVGSFLSSLFVTVVDYITKDFSPKHISWVDSDLSRGHLDYFYWLLAALNFAFFFIFLHSATKYKYNYTTTPVRHVWNSSENPPTTSSRSSYESFELGSDETGRVTVPSLNNLRGPITFTSPDETQRETDFAESSTGNGNWTMGF